jgi:L-2,4-diaminobutyrate decarboxylase
MNDEMLLAHLYSPDAFRKMGHALIDQLANHLEGSTSRQETQAIPYQTPDESLTFWQANADQPLLSTPDALFADVLARSTRVHHPRYVGHQISAVAPAAALAGLLTELLNNGSGAYEMGMAGNAIERIVVEHLARKIGFPDAAGGIITSGGTLANLTALLTARAMLPQDIWHEGMGAERLAIIVSEEAHYCVDRAARIMGLGDAGILKIPVDDRFKMRTDLLEKTLQQAQEAGLTVFAVVGSACSTSTGSHDNLVAIGQFAREYGLWFHVDGAHGGGAFFSPKYRHLLAGAEDADSVVVDYHKMLLVPALATALIYKRGDDAHRTFQQRAQYLWDSTTADWYNSGKRTFECTKFMVGVKVYTLMRLYGDTLFEANINTLYDLGATFAAMIQQRPGFELAVVPECNIVCFRYLRTENDSAALNTLNATIRATLLAEGRFYIVQTTLHGQIYLRVSLMNALTTEQDLTELLDAIEVVGRA